MNEKHNTTVFGVTMFADMSIPEWKAKYLMDPAKIGSPPPSPTPDYKPKPTGRFIPSVNGEPRVSGANLAPNTHYDWIYGTCVSPVNNQAQCGSCWAWSAMEQIETDYTFNNKVPIASLLNSKQFPLSVQQIVDCDTTSYGCNGGWPGSAYDYVKGKGGIESAVTYPYTAVNGQCKDSGPKVRTVSGWSYQHQNDETGLFNYLNSNGPLSVCIDASGFYAYTSGIMPSTACSTSIDHCIQLTGFYTDDQGNVASWNLRNQWGTGWGMQGFVQFQYGKNTCDVTAFPTVVNAS
jgi:C1A family cysteine protease